MKRKYAHGCATCGKTLAVTDSEDDYVICPVSPLHRHTVRRVG